MLKLLLKIKLICICMMLLTSCQNTNHYVLDKNKVYPLKVLYYDSETFASTYLSTIIEKFPNIEVDIVPYKQVYLSESPPQQELMELIAREQPDLMFFNEADYLEAVKNNLLLPIENAVDDSLLRTIHPGSIDLLTYYGEGDLYGIATEITASALFYNKSLFEKYNIPLLEGQVSWQDFIFTARQFSGSGVLGFYAHNNDPASLVTNIGIVDGLSFINSDYSAITLNTDSWVNIFEMVKPMYEEQVINHWNDSLDGNNNPFIEGNAAMTIDMYPMYQSLKEINLPFEWEVLPLPANDPQSAFISLENIITIHAQSKNKEAAALVIEHLLNAQSVRYEELSRNILSTSLLSSVNKDEEHPFHYIFKRHANLGITNLPNEFSLSDKFSSHFFKRYSELARDIMSNNADVREALEELDELGNTLLLTQ